MEWSPPTESGRTPALWMRAYNAAISSIDLSRLKRERIGTSPISAAWHSPRGATLSAWLYGPMRSTSRTARGPKRAPALLVTPRSIGTPTRATSVSLVPVYLARSASSFALSNIRPDLSSPADTRRQHDLPGIGHLTDRDLDQGRPAALQRRRELAAEPLGCRRAHPGGTKALGHLGELRVQQIDADQLVAVILLLHAPDVAKGAVGKHDRDDVDAVLDRRRQLLDVVHKPAVARDRDDRPIRAPDLGAERRRKAKAQSSLVAAVDIGPWMVDRECHPPDIADLRQILDIDPFIGQFGADHLQIFALRAELVREAGERAAL